MNAEWRNASDQDARPLSTFSHAASSRASVITVTDWLDAAEDMASAIRDGAPMQARSVYTLIFAEPSADLAKAMAMGLAQHRLALQADIDTAFRAWPDLAGV